MSRYEILTVQENCTGCLQCQLACSYILTGKFSPHEAQILITDGEEGYTVRFGKDCTRCAMCVEYCMYGALQKRRRQEAI